MICPTIETRPLVNDVPLETTGCIARLAARVPKVFAKPIVMPVIGLKCVRNETIVALPSARPTIALYAFSVAAQVELPEELPASCLVADGLPFTVACPAAPNVAMRTFL